MANEFDDDFKALCESYAKSLPGKISAIQLAFTHLRTTWNMKNLMDFSSLIHKLNGSAGMYGYKLISKKSGEIERRVSRYDYDIAADNQALDEIEKLMIEIKSSLDTVMAETIPFSIQKIQTNLVFLLTDKKNNSFEKSWPTKLTEQAAIFGYEIITFVDIELLFDALKEKTPVALLINFDLLSNPFVINLHDVSVHDMINIYFKRIYTIFIANSGDFEKRLNAVRMGCKSYLIIPFNTDDLTPKKRTLN